MCMGGYGATSVEDGSTDIPSFTLAEVKEKYGLDFDVLVADCEGFLGDFLSDNPDFCDKLRLIIFEADYSDKCDYGEIRDMLREKGLMERVSGHQNVWIREAKK